MLDMFPFSNCSDSSFWGKWVINLDVDAAHDAWSSVTERLGQEHFDHSVFGLVYEYAQNRLSLVLEANQVRIRDITVCVLI